MHTFKPQTTTLIAGSLSVIAYLYLALNSQHYGDANLYQMLTTCAVCGLLSAWVWLTHHQHQEQVSLITLIGFAIAFRFIGLFSFPVLEDDIYRYLWDGRQTVETGTPYIHPPSDFFDADNINDRFESILDGINYPNVATVYGPLCQWIFALAYLISPGEIWPLQLIFSLADIAIIFALLKLAKPNAILLYAWSPLLIKEFAFTAHPDVFGAMLMMFSLLAYRKGNAILIGVLMACATGVKVFPILILPFLLGFQWRGWFAFTVTALAISAPFGITQAWYPEGLRVMGGDWYFNSPIYLSVIKLGPTGLAQIIKTILLLLLGIGAGLYLLKILRDYIKQQWPTPTLFRGDLLFGAFLLCLPALNPWYLVWLLPFAVIKPSVCAWTASLMILMSYASGINLNAENLGAYQHPNWVLCIEFGVIFIAFLIDLTLRNKTHGPRAKN